MLPFHSEYTYSRSSMNSFSKQRTLAMMTGFERYAKKTRRAIFLEEMEQVVPWAKLCALIAPH